MTSADGRRRLQILRRNADPVISSSATPAGVLAIPLSARPYLGRGLDPGLFDVQALAGRARVPVRLTLRAAARPVPGVTVTSTAAGVQHGYLDRDGARAFGAALAAQYRAGRADRWADAGILAGVGSMALDGPATPVARPAFPMHTVSVKVLDAAGALEPFAFVELMDLDDGHRYATYVAVTGASTRLSLPTGHYWASTLVDGDRRRPEQRLVIKEGITINASGQSIVLDARTAASTPLALRRPAGLRTISQDVDLSRTDARGSTSYGFGLSSVGMDLPLRLTPVPQVTLGRQVLAASWSLEPRGSAVPTVWAAAFASPAVLRDQSHRLDPRATAHVSAAIAVDGSTSVSHLSMPAFAGLGFVSGSFVDRSAPLILVQHLSAAPDVSWLESHLVWRPDGSLFPDELDDTAHSYRAGDARTVRWMSGPLVAGAPTTEPAPDVSGRTTCQNCRSVTALTSVLDPVTDSTPGHHGTPALPLGRSVVRFAVYRDGTLLGGGDDAVGAQVSVPAAAGRFRIVSDVTRLGAELSTATHTELAFTSSAGSGVRLPDDSCGHLAGPCRALPLLVAHLGYPVSMTGTLAHGSRPVVLDVAHGPGAAAIPVRRATLELRWPGAAWTRVPLQLLGDGRFCGRLALPAGHAGQRPDLRWTAADTAGSTLSQTVLSAFTVS